MVIKFILTVLKVYVSVSTVFQNSVVMHDILASFEPQIG